MHISYLFITYYVYINFIYRYNDKIFIYIFFHHSTFSSYQTHKKSVVLTFHASYYQTQRREGRKDSSLLFFLVQERFLTCKIENVSLPLSILPFFHPPYQTHLKLHIQLLLFFHYTTTLTMHLL